jgi:uncharacterized protein YidB (DUF937 family)
LLIRSAVGVELFNLRKELVRGRQASPRKGWRRREKQASLRKISRDDSAEESQMGLLDELGLGGVLGDGSALPGLIKTVLAQTKYRDLNGLVTALQQGGLEAEVKSWLGNGANLPLTADQLKSVLGNAQVQDLARQFGVPVDTVLKVLAQYLPNVVDQASPNGTLQPHA